MSTAVSQVSPHERRESEARSHRNGYALLAAAFTVLASLALWGRHQQSTEASPLAPDSLSQKRSAATPQAWRERIESLRQQAGTADSLEVPASVLHSATASLVDALEAADVQSLESADPTWPARVDRLVKLPVEPAVSEGSDPLPPRAAERIEAQIASRIEATIARAEQESEQATAEAIEKAVAEVKDARQSEVRAATLAVRDAQDQIEKLNTAIQRSVRGNEAGQDRARRAAALARDMAEVRSLLSPFILPGYFQPPEGGGYKYERTTDSKPVSLSRLRRAGALDPTKEGLTYLLRFGGGRRTRGNRRPLGSFPQYQGSGSPTNDRNMPQVKRAQALLREHGQALVEAKLLSE